MKEDTFMNNGETGEISLFIKKRRNPGARISGEQYLSYDKFYSLKCMKDYKHKI